MSTAVTVEQRDDEVLKAALTVYYDDHGLTMRNDQGHRREAVMRLMAQLGLYARFRHALDAAEGR